MVPGLAVEEFSTPPSSPVLGTRTTRKTKISTALSVDLKTDTDLPRDLCDMPQLGE